MKSSKSEKSKSAVPQSNAKKLVGIRLSLDTIDGLEILAKVDRRDLSTYARNVLEDHVAEKLKK